VFSIKHFQWFFWNG